MVSSPLVLGGREPVGIQSNVELNQSTGRDGDIKVFDAASDELTMHGNPQEKGEVDWD